MSNDKAQLQALSESQFRANVDRTQRSFRQFRPVLRIKLYPGAKMPTRAYPTDSGLDLYARADVVLSAGSTLRIDTGVAVEIPEGFEGQVRSRSSLASKGIYALFGTIDQSYRGNIGVILTNMSPDRYQVKAGDKIAQLVICPVAIMALVEVEELSASDRGDCGFGSTGI